MLKYMCGCVCGMCVYVCVCIYTEAEEEERWFTVPSLEELTDAIVNESTPIAKRMRTVFLLKQLGGHEAIDVIIKGTYITCA